MEQFGFYTRRPVIIKS
ncbi:MULTISPECIES: hypothetical protein [unclassified Gilliamella]